MRTTQPSEAPRILHVSAIDFTASKLLSPQMDALIEAGYDVRVACNKTNQAFWDDLERFNPIQVPFTRSFDARAMLRSTLALAREVRGWQPHIVHLHTPAISLPARTLPRRVFGDAKIVYTVHGYLHQWPPQGRRDKIVQRLESRLSSRTDLMLFQSSEDLHESRARNYRSQLQLLGNGVEPSWFQIPGPVLPAPADPRHILFTGRLVREKGVIELIEAVARTPNVHLHVAGAALSSDRDGVAHEFMQLRTALDLDDRVTMHGMLTRKQLQELYSQVHFSCLPSHREGLPRSVIESMAAARPAVVSDVRGCRELVDHDRSGLIFTPKDTAGLADALQRLANLDEATYAAMSNHARGVAEDRHREEAVVDRLTQAYLTLIDA